MNDARFQYSGSRLMMRNAMAAERFGDSCRFVCVLLISLLLVSACAGQEIDQRVVSIQGMVIENQGSAWVSAARVLAPVTGRFVSCGNIAPGSMCSTQFPEASYTGAPVEITWSQMGEIHSTGEFDMELPDDLDVDRAATVRVVIAGPGSAGAVIVQRRD